MSHSTLKQAYISHSKEVLKTEMERKMNEIKEHMENRMDEMENKIDMKMEVVEKMYCWG